MNKFALFCKSYAEDFELMKVLLESYIRFNMDNIPFYISVPSVDYKLFHAHLNDKPVFLLTDEEITSELVSDANGWFTPGYINQQIVKLNFWKTNLAENYFCIDSDSVFIRDFYYRDFMFDEEIPYVVLVEDKELCVDPLYYKLYWIDRLEALKRIKSLLGLSEPRLLTCHNNTTLSAKVLRSFDNDFIRVNNFTYVDILRVAPFEYSWYNFWLQKCKIMPIYAVEPLFKMFHTKEQYTDYCNRKITVGDISRAYLGICINSNWARSKREVNGYNCNKRLSIKKSVFEFATVMKNKFQDVIGVVGVFSRFTKKVLLRYHKATREQSLKDYEQHLERTVYYRNIPLMKKAFGNNYVVHHGPFSGMKYIQGSSGSAFLPKILGSYEEPIHNLIKEIVANKRKYKRILDIGCAEGYYAVGFAVNMPDVDVFAYDINDNAREKINKMIEINDARNIMVGVECSPDELNSMSQRGTLVFCDIEGAEKQLLDLARVPNLSLADILVESHDNAESGLTDLLIKRFYKTHAIEMVVDYPARKKRYATPNPVSSEDYDEIINEHRAEAMKWLYMKSLSQ